MILRNWIYSGFICIPFLLTAQQVKLEQWTQQELFEGAHMSILCVKMNGDIVDSYRPDDYLIPASNLKLWTTAAALDILGPEFRFVTRAGIDGEIKEGILSGNLWLKGDGDPSWNSEHFSEHTLDQLAAQIYSALRQNGIREIQGDLILDAGGWDDSWHHRDWSWADIGNYYGISSGAFNIYDNAQVVQFNTSGSVGAPADILKTQPDLDISWDNQVIIGSASSGDQAYVFGNAQDKQRIIRGSVPKSGSTFQIKASLARPDMVFGTTLLRKLKEKGLQFHSGTEVLFSQSGERELLAEYSPDLTELCLIINHDSNNLFAEAVYNYLKTYHSEPLEQWTADHISESYYRWKDGCGLSPYNRFSARCFADLLKSKSKDVTFKESLAAPGERGTLKYRFKDVKLRAKTGSIEGVYALSGYLWNNEGEKFCFSILINNFQGSYRQLYQELTKLFLSWSE